MTGQRVVTIGETMALLGSTRYGPLQHNHTMTLGIGGSESNVAIALSRLGADATWIGRVGTDPLGDLIIREITARRVRPRGRTHQIRRATCCRRLRSWPCRRVAVRPR